MKTLAHEVLGAALAFGRAAKIRESQMRSNTPYAAEAVSKFYQAKGNLEDLAIRYSNAADKCPVREDGDHCEHRERNSTEEKGGTGCHACQDPGSSEVNYGRCTSDHFP